MAVKVKAVSGKNNLSSILYLLIFVSVCFAVAIGFLYNSKQYSLVNSHDNASSVTQIIGATKT